MIVFFVAQLRYSLIRITKRYQVFKLNAMSRSHDGSPDPLSFKSRLVVKIGARWCTISGSWYGRDFFLSSNASNTKSPNLVTHLSTLVLIGMFYDKNTSWFLVPTLLTQKLSHRPCFFHFGGIEVCRLGVFSPSGQCFSSSRDPSDSFSPFVGQASKNQATGNLAGKGGPFFEKGHGSLRGMKAYSVTTVLC